MVKGRDAKFRGIRDADNFPGGLLTKQTFFSLSAAAQKSESETILGYKSMSVMFFVVLRLILFWVRMTIEMRGFVEFIDTFLGAKVEHLPCVFARSNC
jgi:hypothetical protein